MRITRLVLGALAPLAVAMPALGADPAAGTAPAAEATAPAQPGTRTVAMGPAVRDAQGNEGRIHTVVPGDTLWDISEAYLGSPFSWPSIWKKNPAVRNPNRIYPGDRIFVSATEMRPLTAQEASTFAPSPSGVDAAAKPVGMFAVPSMASIGFIGIEEMDTAGSVIGSPDPEKLLSALRRVYVSLGEGQTQVGDTYTVIREEQRVRDPETKDFIGVHVRKLGWLEITRVGPESSEAIVRVSSNAMEIGDRLIPRIEPAIEVPIRVGGSTTEGQIALLPSERTVTGEGDVMYLNRGTDEGIDVGSSLEIYRPSGVARDAVTKSEHVLPDDVIGNMIVVSARPTTSVAIVTHSNVEVELGDHFRDAPSIKTSYRQPVTPPLDGARWTARTIEGRDAAQPPAKAAPTR